MRSLQQLMNLHGRAALITGGAGHLGMSMAESLAECGASLVLADKAEARPQEKADRLAADFGISAVGLDVDLSVEEQVLDLPEAAAGLFGGIDILVNNAAFVGTSDLQGWVTDFEQQNIATWRKALEVNLTAAFALSQKSAPWLRRSGKGCIINISSVYGVCGPDLSLYEGTAMGNPAAYAASKGGLLQLTRWLATVLAPEVRVNAICPGGVWRNQPEAFHKRYNARTPLQRMATEEDFKGAAAYLAGDLSAYVTGHTLMVDGGFSCW